MFILDALSEERTVTLTQHSRTRGNGFFTLPIEVGAALGWKLSLLRYENLVIMNFAYRLTGNQPVSCNVAAADMAAIGWKIGDQLTWEVDGTKLTIRKAG